MDVGKAANNKNIGGMTMSSNKGALRRLSLLAGSSMVAASLSAAALTGVALTPTAALAYDECVPANGTTLSDGTNGVSDPTLNGTTADGFACAATSYPAGITYNSAGDLTVTKTTSASISVGSVGVNLTGNGADNVTWNSTAGRVDNTSAATSPTINVTSASGDISIATGSVFGQAGATHAIRASSSGGGDITIATTGGVNANGSASVAAIEATSTGGDISISTSGTSSFDQTSGRLRAIFARTSGTGDITLNVGAPLNSTTATGPVIETVASMGLTTLNFTTGIVGANGFLGTPQFAHPQRVLIRSTSAGAVVVQNSGAQLYGAVDFSGVTGAVTFSNTGTGIWRATGASVFGSGNDTLTFSSTAFNVIGNGLAEGQSINFGAGNDTLNVVSSFALGSPAHFGFSQGESLGLGATLTFGAGTDTINNSGSFSADGPVMVTGLETFNNTGLLALGPIALRYVDPVLGDLDPDDILTMPGATFNGSGASRLHAAMHFDTSEQASCATPTGAGDCLYLPGGTTAGSTLITLVNAGDPAQQGGFNGVGVTIVDVNGGTSAAGHFTLDPNSPGYRVDPLLGAVIQRPGLFAYRLTYDPDTQRHAMVGLPRSEALEYVVLGSAAQSIWYMTSQAVTDRQTDLREGTEGSVWMKVSGEYTTRDVVNSIDAFADTFAFDNSYKLYAGTLMGGMDFITGHSGGYDYVLGAQIGYVGSTFDLDASPSSGQMTGATGGVYGSLWDGAMFLDATFNSNFLTLDYDAPGLGSKTTTWLRSYGAQLEGGRRFMLTRKLFAEPLVTAAFVRSHFEEISLVGGEIAPEDADSRRAALGLRLGADMFGGPLKVRYYVTGRAWNEFEGENQGVVFNPGADLPFAEDTSGSFGEAQAGFSLFNADQTIAGFLNSGVKFKDGYNAVDLDLGLRLRW